MADIVNLEEYKTQAAVKAGFAHWQKCFKAVFGRYTQLAHLSDEALCCLAEPGETSMSALYGLILGFMGFDADVVFDDLEAATQSRVLDVQLFMADQIRFEMLYRLGWLASFDGRNVPLFDMVTDFDRARTRFRHHLPELAPDHSGFDEYRRLTPRDQQVFIRRMLPLALERYRNSLSP